MVSKKTVYWSETTSSVKDCPEENWAALDTAPSRTDPHDPMLLAGTPSSRRGVATHHKECLFVRANSPGAWRGRQLLPPPLGLAARSCERLVVASLAAPQDRCGSWGSAHPSAGTWAGAGQLTPLHAHKVAPVSCPAGLLGLRAGPPVHVVTVPGLLCHPQQVALWGLLGAQGLAVVSLHLDQLWVLQGPTPSCGQSLPGGQSWWVDGRAVWVASSGA